MLKNITAVNFCSQTCYNPVTEVNAGGLITIFVLHLHTNHSLASMAYTSSLGKIYVVDEDSNIMDLLLTNLNSEGYSVEGFSKAADIMSQDLGDVSLIIVDAMQQKFNGLHLIAQLKANPLTAHTAIILYTANASERILIEALDLGADDFVMKPFSLRELVARVRTVMRRMTRPAVKTPGQTLSYSTLKLDLMTGKVTDDGMELPVTKTEFAILKLLLRNVGTPISRFEIYHNVWQDDNTGNDRIVDTNISRLRKKLGELSTSLVNRSGLGYMFV